MLNEYQMEIARFFQGSMDHMLVSARAGTGKTKLITAMATLPKNRGQRVLFGAFTNATGKEIKERSPALAPSVRTSHSIGLEAIKKALGPVEVEPFKYARIYREIVGTPAFKKACSTKKLKESTYLKPAIQNEVLRILSNFQVGLNTFDPLSPPVFEPVVDYGVELWIIQRCLEIGLKQSLEGVIGFPDMITLPLDPSVFDPGIFQKYDKIYLDEAQDLSEAQLQLYGHSMANDCQVIAVGDEFQSIFQFAGATNSIELLRQRLNPKEYTMPLCYRCPTEVLDLAREIVPDIQGLGRSGTVETLGSYEATQQLSQKAKEGSCLVITRTNALLIPMALSLINMGQSFAFVGDALENRIKAKIGYYRDTIPFDNLLDHLLSQPQIGDIDGCVIEIIRHCDRYSEAYTVLRKIFYNHGSNLRLSTAHSAKGTEADHVLIWGYDYFPHPKATEDTLQQEENLRYVAITRAKVSLTLCYID